MHSACRDLESSAALGSESAHASAFARGWWYFIVFVRPWMFRGVAVSLATLSALILWGEVTVGFSANLSPLAHLVAAVDSEFLNQVRPRHCAPLTHAARVARERAARPLVLSCSTPPIRARRTAVCCIASLLVPVQRMRCVCTATRNARLSALHAHRARTL